MAVCRAPLWLRKATSPLWAIAPAKVALRPVGGHMMPRQLGPTMRIRAARAIPRISCSSRAPSMPVSLKPAEMMMAPRMPAAAHSRITPGTTFAGVMTTARSIRSGTAATLGYALTPRTLARFALTGKTVPPKGFVNRFQSTVRPTLPGVSLAPMTATLRGAKNTSSGWRAAPPSRSVGGSPGFVWFSLCSIAQPLGAVPLQSRGRKEGRNSCANCGDLAALHAGFAQPYSRSASFGRRARCMTLPA